jgi:hypothetical protein
MLQVQSHHTSLDTSMQQVAEDYQLWQAMLDDPNASWYDQHRARTQIAYLKKNFAAEFSTV